MRRGEIKREVAEDISELLGDTLSDESVGILSRSMSYKDLVRFKISIADTKKFRDHGTTDVCVTCGAEHSYMSGPCDNCGGREFRKW